MSADLGPASKEWPRIPVLVTSDKPVDQWLEKESGSDLAFKTTGVGRPNDLVFRPFYEIHENRYATYFNLFSQDQWNTAEAEYRAEEERLRDLEKRTVDYVRIGERQPERDHKLKSEKNDVRQANGRSFRTPLNGGWFEFEMKVDGSTPCNLVVTYWGNERTKPDFMILIDGKEIASETLGGKPMNKFFDVVYLIPDTLTKGRDHIIVRLQAAEHKGGGSVSAVRIVRLS